MRTVLFAVPALLVLAAGVCQKVPERQWERGFFEPIGGRPYRLPPGLDLVSCYGYDDEIPASFLPLEMVLHNATAQSVSATLPAGLVFEPNDIEYQYMMLLQPFTFAVPAGADTALLLPTYCCNFDLDTPDDESNYAIAIQIWERELNELIELVRGKRLEGEDAVDLAQEALYEITDGEGLTDSTRVRLQNLP